jgi:hypothetical protein
MCYNFITFSIHTIRDRMYDHHRGMYSSYLSSITFDVSRFLRQSCRAGLPLTSTYETHSTRWSVSILCPRSARSLTLCNDCYSLTTLSMTLSYTPRSSSSHKLCDQQSYRHDRGFFGRIHRSSAFATKDTIAQDKKTTCHLIGP